MKWFSNVRQAALAVLIASGAAAVGAPGDLLNNPDPSQNFNPKQPVQTFTASQIDQLKAPYLGGLPSTPSKNGVIVFKITYETTDLMGQATLATGVLMIPDATAGAGPFPLVSFQHPTSMTRTVVPSNLASGMALPAAFLFTAQGYVVAAADYLGMGDSPGIHPYMHAATEATATADLLRATRKAVAQIGIALNSQLFLTGYSQGGHSTMALHRYLESTLANEFTVTASAPGAGPYDLSHSVMPTLLKIAVPASVAEICYTLQSMGAAYGINSALQADVVPAVWAQIPTLFDGSLIEGASPSDPGTILARLPVTTPTQLFLPAALAKIQSVDPSDAFVAAMIQNDVYQWVPKAPVRLYFSGGDKEVPPQDSQVAYDYMQSQGANVQLVKVSDTMDHITAMVPSLKAAADWFDTLRLN